MLYDSDGENGHLPLHADPSFGKIKRVIILLYGKNGN